MCRWCSARRRASRHPSEKARLLRLYASSSSGLLRLAERRKAQKYGGRIFFEPPVLYTACTLSRPAESGRAFPCSRFAPGHARTQGCGLIIMRDCSRSVCSCHGRRSSSPSLTWIEGCPRRARTYHNESFSHGACLLQDTSLRRRPGKIRARAAVRVCQNERSSSLRSAYALTTFTRDFASLNAWRTQ